MNRREFITGAASLSLVGWRGIARAAGYPDYWAANLACAADRVNGLAASCDDGFWFITDLHIKSNRRRSGELLAELARRTPLRNVLCGGDLPEAFGKGYPKDRDAVDYAIDAYRKVWVEPIRAAGGRVYTAKGNHDFTVCHSHDAPEDRTRGFTYDGVKARELLLGEFTEKGVVANAADPEAAYFYFDNAAAKMRYVVADTTDSQTAGDVPWGVRYGMKDAQLRWLASEAFATAPEGYGIAVMHHIPVTGLVGNAGDEKTFAPFRRLMEAYQNRGTFEVAGERFDFAAAKGRILIDLTGHHHCEMQTFQRGILHVTNPCDAAYKDYIDRSKPWCGDLPEKRSGTPAEQTFDAVQFDRRGGLVHFTRVGGGQDRTIHLAPRTVRTGEEVRFEARHLRGDLTWGCYDADSVTNIPNPANRWMRLAQYHNTLATITPGGVLAPRKAGEIVVLAMDANFNKEIFPVTIG